MSIPCLRLANLKNLPNGFLIFCAKLISYETSTNQINLSNDVKILAIGSSKTISYQYQSSSEMISNYFNIIDESNKQLISLIDKYKIQSQQYFPIYGFSTINAELESSQRLKTQQFQNLTASLNRVPERCKTEHLTIDAILKDDEISKSYKAKEREKNNFTFLTGYFVLILHFKTLKISTFMRVSKPKLRTNSLRQESKFIYFAFQMQFYGV